jgi:predicted regulator of Ras-like GTPase activity (Roadblock/LC7/MglB family)
MGTAERVEDLGSMDGVSEATLCGSDGTFVSSSASQPRLGIVASDLRLAVQAIQGAMPDLGAPMTLTVEGENGALHMAQTPASILILSTTNDANLGAVKMEMREALQSAE